MFLWSTSLNVLCRKSFDLIVIVYCTMKVDEYSG